jgi:hypothetical protein
MFSLNSHSTIHAADEPAETHERQELFSGLVTAYQERGYEAGYARGANDALASVLEAIEEFARPRPESAGETRRLLYAFSEFLENKVCQTPPRPANDFVDGLGI